MSLSAQMTGATLTTLHEVARDLAGGAVDVDFDKTVLVQMAVFCVLMLVLKPTLFDPMLKLFAEREERTEKTKERARATDKASQEALTKYEDAMAKARATAGGEREKIRAEALKVENEILAKVRTSTGTLLDSGRRQRETEVAQVRAQLQEQSKELARDLAGRVLGREVQP